MPGTSLASENARLVRPATVAVLLFDVLPRPMTGAPVSSVTVKLTTGGLLMLTLVTVTCGASAAHAAADASLAGVALLGMYDHGAGGGPRRSRWALRARCACRPGVAAAAAASHHEGGEEDGYRTQE